jgi:hypothetical protein
VRITDWPRQYLIMMNHHEYFEINMTTTITGHKTVSHSEKQDK